MSGYDSSYYMSPVDGHDHFTKLGREGCAVCALETERDQLRAVVDADRRADTGGEDEEPEVQHLANCEHPIAPCSCPRGHLLAEGRRLREMVLFAEAEFARENQRAVDLKIERDRLRAENAQFDALTAEKRLRAIVERDRLRAGLETLLDGLVGIDNDDAYVAITMEHLELVRALLRTEAT